MEHATEYYRELFGPETEYDISLDPSIWDHTESLEECDNEILSKPFSESEVKVALFQMEKK